MRGDPQVIQHLNKVLLNELTTINQYEGLPNLQDLGKLMIGENAKEALECDLKQEQGARPVLQAAIAHCEAVKDYVSRELFEDILDSEEEHIDWLETQLGLLEQLGLQNWLQSQAISPS
jgi:bacterioferritin